MSTLSVLRTNAGLFCRAVVSNRDLPQARRAIQGWCDGKAVFKLRADGRPRDLTVRCYAFDAEHTAFDAATSVAARHEVELEWTLLHELPHGHIGVARQLDDANRVRSHALLTRNSPALALLAPSNTLWTAAARSPEPWLIATLCALLIALFWRGAQLWRRRPKPDMPLHRGSDAPSQVKVRNHARRGVAPVDDSARSA